MPRLKGARSVVIAVRVRRTELEELGGRGLEGPVVVYRVGKDKR